MKNTITLIIMLVMSAMFTGCSSYEKTPYVHEKGVAFEGNASYVITLETGHTIKVYKYGSPHLGGRGRLMALKVDDKKVPANHVFSKPGGLIPEKIKDNEVSYNLDDNVIYVSYITEEGKDVIKVRGISGTALVPLD